MVEVRDDGIWLRKLDGSVITVPLAMISKADREYVKQATQPSSPRMSAAEREEFLASLPEWKKRRVALDQMHRVEEFRIFYALTGHDALPDPMDSNDNGVPDKIENIAIQLVVARSVYVDVMKLRHPLESPRYKDAKYVDVHVATMPLDPNAKKSNGQAGDAIINFNRPTDPEGGYPAITIDISNDLKFDNLTPAHELFHSFQYGYTMFKTSWFLEGTARWAEFALRAGAGQPGYLPKTKQEIQELFNAKYEASKFWYTLASMSDTQGKLRIPIELRRTRYIGNTKTVIEDDVLYGSAFTKKLLESLDRTDDVASQENNLEPYGWKEARQRSAENNPYIWSATVEVVRDSLRRSPQVWTMLRALGPST